MRSLTWSRIAVLVSAGLWATTGPASRLAPEFSAVVLSCARLGLGGAVLVSWLALRGRRPLSAATAAPGSLVTALLLLAAFQWSYFAATAAVGSGMAAVLSAVSAALAGEVVSLMRGRTAPGPSLIACACGTSLAAFAAHGGSAGLLAGLASGVAYALYAELTAHAEQRAGEGAGLAITGLALLGAGATLLPVAGADLAGLLSPSGLSLALYLGVITATLAYGLFVYGMRGVGAREALGLLTFQPLIAAGLGGLLLGETLELTAMLAVAATAIGSLFSRKAPPAEAALQLSDTGD